MRREFLKNIRRVVIKLGSRVLTDDSGSLDGTVIRQLCSDVAELRMRGIQVVLVSSGAVAAGRNALGMPERSGTIPQKQAAAAVGQPRLMRLYQECFEQHGLVTGQVLLTADDLASRQRFLNARGTLEALLAAGAVPVINENDTVTVAEIKFGDNDNLSALVTNLVEANLLLILTDIEGLYTANPAIDPTARLIPLVRSVTREIERAAGGSGSSVGTGGMATKVAAAKKAARYGVPTLMAPGKRPGVIGAALAGTEIGTLFLPADKGLNRRKHWIAYTLRPAGKVLVDAGARTALLEKGTSLLPSGIQAVEGRFERGSCVRICGPDGEEFARGVSDYGSAEIALIAGRKSAEIEEVLGYHYGDAVVHRDNLALK
ncbi:glutamate 5-kinase [Trichlorobacter ammonificans]|uniref:Glutamate 5-kinase n=1 Tax=Trichlorobacter ammonificans TaxID=2916410 RepID=A0ABN8HJP7_9BACT|nr:glutamate 5-kinase [Trichlorobacter ammonificans]CAH2031835.1 Glutamate 5-kinase [Trichlorobacter ammonificans]